MLRDKKIDEFIDLMGSDAPAPGGGASAALNCAQGAALAAMTAKITLTNDKYSKYFDVCSEASSKLEKQTRIYLELMEKDADAYEEVIRAYRLQKSGENEQKEERRAAIEKALTEAMEIPLSILRLAADTLTVTDSLVGRSSAGIAGDLGASACNIESGVRISYLNILANARSIKDRDAADKALTEARELFLQIQKLSDGIYMRVKASLL
ncbi:MAG: cyclodeaminase/cyclohydrolase family protein [Oscillospiraceae bacterium]